MTKLNNKLGTIPSKETRHKRDTNFPFAILPKQKKDEFVTLPKIDKYLPTKDGEPPLGLHLKYP